MIESLYIKKTLNKEDEKKYSNQYVVGHPYLPKLIGGRKFKFEQNKVNIIFGPNGCGKTTILKAIGGYCGSTNGMLHILEPLDIFGLWDGQHTFEYGLNRMEEYYCKMQKNASTVIWDGTPIYYFDNTEISKVASSSVFGDMVGTLFADNVREETVFTLERNRISTGQKAIYLINRLFGIANKKISIKQLIEKDEKKYKYANDLWTLCYAVNKAYWKRKCGDAYDKEVHPTLLIDEFDDGVDIETVYMLFDEVLPKIAEKMQVIIISHSPILTSKKFSEGIYNFISIDDNYTSDVRNLMKSLEF